MELGRTQIGIGIAVLAIAALFAVPLFMSTGKSSLRAELPLNVESIRAYEIQYHGAFETYVSAEAAPREALAVDGNAVPWVPTAGFKKLSWEPPESTAVRGSYSVNAKRDGFTVTGVSDLDEDQVQARFQATLDEEAKALTDDSVY